MPQADRVTAAPQTCAYCSEPASGRFCSSCGKELAVSRRGRSVVRDIFGSKRPPLRSVLRTAWLAIAQPHVLSQRWCCIDRKGLTSPVAMMTTVAAFSTFVAVALANLTGHQIATDGATDTARILDAAPFLRSWFPQAFHSALSAPELFETRFRQVGSWFVAFWPAMFLIPGVAVLAPWRRISRHDALILACVETVFIMALTGVYSAIATMRPGAGGGWTELLIWLVLVAHTALHVRRVVSGAGWGYAVTRPILATLLFPVVIYAWAVVVMTVTLALGSLTS